MSQDPIASPDFLSRVTQSRGGTFTCDVKEQGESHLQVHGGHEATMARDKEVVDNYNLEMSMERKRALERERERERGRDRERKRTLELKERERERKRELKERERER